MIFGGCRAQLSKASTTGDRDDYILKLMHKTISAGTADLERFHFNKYVARLREFHNDFEKYYTHMSKNALEEALKTFLQLLNPIIPHITEELWSHMGQKELLVFEPWPKADPAYLKDDTVEMVCRSMAS